MPIATDEAVIRIRGEVDPSLELGAAKVGAEFRLLADKVKLASADLQAGVITQQQYQAALQSLHTEMVALRQTGVVPVGRDLGAFNAVARATAPVAASATPILSRMRNMMGAMTATAIGARGAVGTLGGALLQFAAGNTIAVGVIGGIAAITLAWRKLTEETRKAREEHVKYVREASGAFEAEVLGPARPIETRLAGIRAERAALMGRLQEAQRGRLVVRPGGLTETVVDQAAIDRITKDLIQNTRAIATEEKRLADLRKREADETRKLVEERTAALWRRIGPIGDIQEEAARRLAIWGPIAEQRFGPTPLAGRPGVRMITPRYANEGPIGAAATPIGPGARVVEDLRQREFALLQTRAELTRMLKAGQITQNEYARALKEVDGATERAAFSTERFAVAAINTAAALVSQIASGGGGLGGFLGLAGGLLSFVPGWGPIAGAAVGGLGAIVSASGRRDEPVPVRISDVTDQSARKLAEAQKRGPDRVTIMNITNTADVLATRELIRRLDRRDAVDRLAGVA